MKTGKKVLSWFLVALMLLTMVPGSTYAAEPVEAGEVTTEETTETTTDSTTESGEMTTETVTEAVTTEQITESITEQVEEPVTEMPETTENEEREETAETAVFSSLEESTPVLTRSGQERITELESAVSESPTGMVQADGSWGDGYYWYVYTGSKGNLKKHYIFCIDHGMEMHEGVYTPTLGSALINTEKTTFRIAVAMNYFKANGGWSSKTGYADAQRAVWNSGGTDVSNHLITYANNLYNLKYGGTSFSSALTKVDGKDWDDVKDVSLNSKKVSATDGKVKNAEISLSGTGWKYFAGGAGGWGNISVAGIYDKDGKSVKSKVTAEVTNKGNLKCSFDESVAKGKKNAITVVMKVDGDYGGDKTINYLNCGSGKQRLTFDAEANHICYFAVQVYTGKADRKGAAVSVKKTDEFGNAIAGATFKLLGVDYDATITPEPDDPDSWYFPEITKAGFYSLQETKAPDGMQNSSYSYQIEAVEYTEGSTTGIKLKFNGSEDTFLSIDATSTDTNLQFNVKNNYYAGSAYLRKMGEMMWKWNGTDFEIVRRELYNVTFSLYAEDDITLQNGDVLFAAGTEITQEVLDASIWNQSVNNRSRSKATIEWVTSQKGKETVKYNNLPQGNYYVVETSTASGYVQDISRQSFTIMPKVHNTKITNKEGEEEGDFINVGKSANVYIKKLDADKKKDGTEEPEPVAGAQFTLYANVHNTTPDRDYFFSTDQTEPAVTYRDADGTPTYEYNTWVPLKTAVSDANGEVDFAFKNGIPAYPGNEYMVVETKPAPDYCYANSDENGNPTGVASYRFHYDNDGNMVSADGTGDEADQASGNEFWITMRNKEQSNGILIRKTGELLYDASTEKTEYGNYRKLDFRSMAAKDVVFEIRDEEGNVIQTITTGEDGTAEVTGLKPGVYYVAEVSTNPELQIDSEPKRVEFSKDSTETVQVKEVEFTNHSLSTKLHIYKTGEQAVLNETPVKGVSSTDSIYRYDKIPLAGVVFGIYAGKDITNYNGAVVVKAGSCVGYAVTDSNGEAVLSNKLVSGEYYYREIRTAGDSYRKDTGIYPFSLKLDGSPIDRKLNADSPVVNEWMKGSVKVIKTDGETKKALSGVQFTLYDSRKNALAELVTDDNGEMWVDRLPIGTYYLQETETLEGYILDETMHEINLTGSKLSCVLEIENEKEEEKDTYITVSAASGISGMGGVKTGDMLTRILMMIMGAAMMALLLLLRIRTSKEKVVMKRLWTILLAVLMVSVLLPDKVQAANYYNNQTVENCKVCYDGVEQDNVKVTIDGSTSYLVVKILRNGDTEFETEGCRLIDSTITAKSEAGFTGTYNGTPPKEIQITGSLTEESFGVNKTTYSINIQDKVTCIVLDRDMYVTIPEESNVERFKFHGVVGELPLSELLNCNINLQCSKYDVKVDFGIEKYLTVKSEAEYILYKNLYQDSWVVRYGSPAHFNVNVICDSSGQGVKKWQLEPGYIRGDINYELNGGANHPDNPKGYVVGGPTELSVPTRHNYQFAGWYSAQHMTSDTLCKDNVYWDINKDSGKVNLYAKWLFHVETEQDGISYVIGADKAAMVTAGQGVENLVIPEQITYEGVSYPVTAIGENAFSDAMINTVTIPKSIQSVGKDAFTGCNNLKDVHMNSNTVSLQEAFPKSVNLYASTKSEAYKKYEEEGYTGQKYAPGCRINYVLNGGTNHPDNPEVYEFNSVLYLKAATRDNYRFDGWYSDIGMTNKVTKIHEETCGDITLYARYTPVVSDAVASDEVIGQYVEDAPKTDMSAATLAQVKSVKLVNKKGRKLRISITGSNAEGYEIRYGTSKSMKKSKTIKITGTSSSASKTIKKLKKGKTYYVRVRAYNHDSKGDRMNGRWSKVKKVKIKK